METVTVGLVEVDWWSGESHEWTEGVQLTDR